MSLAFIDTVLAGLNVERAVRDAITGDLLEERAQRAAFHGDRSADRWMRQQILRSVLAFVLAAFRDGGFRLLAATVGPALAALLAVSVVIGVSTAVLSALVSPATLGRLTIVVFAIDLAFGAAGGYLAARLGRAVPLVAAFLFGTFAVLVTGMSSGDGHGWYGLMLQLLLIPATVSGGWLQARHLVRCVHSA